MIILHHSPHTEGRFVLGVTSPLHELISGDVIEMQVNSIWIQVRIEHDSQRYYALAGAVRIPLRAGMPARRVQR